MSSLSSHPTASSHATRHRTVRVLELLNREKQHIKRDRCTNDYLEGYVHDESRSITAQNTSMLQMLDEPLLHEIFSHWCSIVETKLVADAEQKYLASRLFDSLDHEHDALTDEYLHQVRANLRLQFREMFSFDREKKQLAAKTNATEEKFDSRVDLAEFTEAMWSPLVKTGFFTPEGSRQSQGGKKILKGRTAEVLRVFTHCAVPLSTSNTELGEYLKDLFTSIDNTQTNYVTWGDFVTYIIERVYNHSLSGKNSASMAVRVDSRAMSKDANGSIIYRDSFHMKFPVHKQHWVQKIYHFAQGGWDSMVALDGNHAIVTLLENLENQHEILDGDEYAAQFENKDDSDEESYKHEQLEERMRVSAASHIANDVYYFGHRGAVNSCEWISKEKLFLTVATEPHQLRIWSVHNRDEFRLLNHLRVTSPDESAVTAVRVDEKRLLNADTIKLFFGTRSGHVLVGDVIDADQIKRCNKVFPTTSVKLHSEAVTDMLVVPRSQRLVSCGLDGRIFGVTPGEDLSRGVTEFVGHKRGILSMSYCNGYEVFVTGGFEYFALCWAENLPRSPAFKLEDVVQPHQYPICSVMSVPRTPNVYTMDITGILKVYDVRTLKPLGSWGAFDLGRVPNHVLHEIQAGGGGSLSCSDLSHSQQLVASACYTGSKNRSILIGSRAVHRFLTESRNGDADRPLDISDPLVAFDVGQISFLTAAATVVRVWSIKTGKITATHRTIRYSQQGVSAAAVDDYASKIITGHADGQVNVFHRDSGALLRRYRYHQCRVTIVALDAIHGVFMTSSLDGEICFWRDRDAASSSLGPLHHSKSYQPAVEAYYERQIPKLPDEMSVILRFSPPPSVRIMSLSRWVINRWWFHILIRKQSKQNGAGGPVPEDGVRTVITPNFSMHLLYPTRAAVMCASHARVAILSSKAVCRVMDYSVMPPLVTHRLFHGKDRPLVAVALMSDRNLACVSDIHGILFLWLLPTGRSAVLLASFVNKCLVSSYSHPHEEFRDATDEISESPGVVIPAALAAKMKAEEEAASGDSGMPPYKPPTAAIPAVTSMWLDPYRFSLITGDDVGFVSIWELETVLRGRTDLFEALQESQESGVAPRWVYAWRAHPLPVHCAQVMGHTSYSVVTQGADNMVSLWTVNGDWLAGLRQGPVVDRSWLFPYPLLAKGALIRLRFEKIHQAFKTKELARLRRVRDGEELDVPQIHPELSTLLFAPSRRGLEKEEPLLQLRRLMEPKTNLPRSVGWVKRFSVSLKGSKVMQQTNNRSAIKLKIRGESATAEEKAEEDVVRDEAETSMQPRVDVSFVAFAEQPHRDEDDLIQQDSTFGNVVDEMETLEKNLWNLAQRRNLKVNLGENKVALRGESEALSVDKTNDNSRVTAGVEAHTTHRIARQVNTLLTAQSRQVTVRELNTLRLGEATLVHDRRQYFDHVRDEESGANKYKDSGSGLAESKKTVRSRDKTAAVDLSDVRDFVINKQKIFRTYTPQLSKRGRAAITGVVSLGGRAETSLMLHQSRPEFRKEEVAGELRLVPDERVLCDQKLWSSKMDLNEVTSLPPPMSESADPRTFLKLRIPLGRAILQPLPAVQAMTKTRALSASPLSNTTPLALQVLGQKSVN